MSLEKFSDTVAALCDIATELIATRGLGKPEETTKDRLIEPVLDALGYTPPYRTLEGTIRSLLGTATWVDYLLLPEKRHPPKLMLEAKSIKDTNIWAKNQQQVLEYLRNYSLDIDRDEPVLWIILTNFREWSVLRLQDREPFWTFTLADLQQDPELVRRFYACLSRESLRAERLEAFYTEKTRAELGARFLADLKVWRVILANGIRQSQPNLGLEKVREAAQVILNRFLLIRLLEAFSREMPFNYLGRVYHNWQQTFPDLPFIEDLRRAFYNTWVGYNTELFQRSWIDELFIEIDYLEPIIVLNAIPREGRLWQITGTLTDYRSLYNYDFTTLTQDILGTAYEQFLAHELILVDDLVKVLENQQTRKREGIFYTPDYIVRRIVYQTLQPLVKLKIDQAIEHLQTKEFELAYTVASEVLEITVIDPACGSGSFLLGAFDYLLGELKRYNQACTTVSLPDNFDLFNHAIPQPLVNPEELILVKVLHGVDRDPQAVLLAKLSLWTRLLRARPGEYGRRNGSIYSRLPALTLNIRVGDSLIHAPVSLEPFESDLNQARDLANIARDPNQSDAQRNQAAQDLEKIIDNINAEINPVLAYFFASDASIQSAVKVIKKRDANPEELAKIREFIRPGQLATAIYERWVEQHLPNWTVNELSRLKTDLVSLETALGDVVIKRPFNWPVEFPHIFDCHRPESEQGFMVVIGNPPYFNVDATFGRGALELDWLRFAYSDIYTDKTDILFYFIRWGFELLRSDGYLSFIVSRAFIQGDKSERLRDFLRTHTKIISIIDFLGNKVFNAGIATCILEIQKLLPESSHFVNSLNILNLNQAKQLLDRPIDLLPSSIVVKTNISQSQLSNARWEISPYIHIFRLIDEHGVKIRESNLVSYTEGITSGRDSIFEGEFQDRFPKDFLLDRVAGSLIDCYGCQKLQTQILYYTHQTDWDDLPKSIKKYLNSHKVELENRDVFKNVTSHYNWYHLHRPRYGMRDAKIIFPRRCSSNKFFVDEYGTIGFKSDVAAFIKEEGASLNDLFYLCSLLNSKVIQFRYRCLGGIGKLTGQGMFEYFENQVGDLPIPVISDPDNNPNYQALVRLGREAHQAWQDRYQILMAYHAQSTALPHQEKPLNLYFDLLGDYVSDLAWSSPIPNQEGYLLKFRVDPKADGLIIWAEVTDEEDWRDGNRNWVELLQVKISNTHLRRYLLAQLIYLTEFDSTFRRKQKLSSTSENLIHSVLNVIKLPYFDLDRFNNLRILDLLEKRVNQSVGRSDIEAISLRQLEIRHEIDQIAYRLYGVAEYIETIEQALATVL
ncbi:Eco57I restriction-modification methylase domain-containing protein [Thermosynechococcaceae cyanobacterium BACA0444]|uniref:site-specific DNA-methyltransferase (adenine-specific) n=1 Tax=Pseudocalidococcus azoricus BACA0444 TaxID=2918990 RepID=A0AAE4JZ89_9CYAN|nr:Eco57I restriction-modification methylase domain-containing protein [Pseudocalidococcus azoricus]MDS3860562.1 Eco57I restriction-modification methylase domain-containing protein [Pseudocalidococcus azoricus BACA0444]